MDTQFIFGDNPEPASFVEDDGESYNFERGTLNKLTLSCSKEKGGSIASSGEYKGSPRYKIINWEKIPLKPAT